MIRKLFLIILTIVCLSVFIGMLSGVAAKHYQNYQNKQAPAEPVITQREADKNVAAVKSAAVADKRAQVEKFNGQVAECQKGRAAYDMLTAYQKARVAAPVCATPQPIQPPAD